MTWQITKLFLAATVITLTSWLAGKQPRLAGFILALPISTLLALAFTQIEFNDVEKTVAFAKSIFFAVPISLLFFLPFLFSGKTGLGFWPMYFLGIGLLAGGYLIHAWIVG